MARPLRGQITVIVHLAEHQATQQAMQVPALRAGRPSGAPGAALRCREPQSTCSGLRTRCCAAQPGGVGGSRSGAAPPAGLHHHSTEARQHACAHRPAPALGRRQQRGQCRAAAAQEGSNLRVPHSGYHYDGTPRRCECRGATRRLPQQLRCCHGLPGCTMAAAASSSISSGSACTVCCRLPWRRRRHLARVAHGAHPPACSF